MKAIETEITGVWILEPEVHTDSRGYFMESFSEREFRRLTGVERPFVQDNESLSARGVVRGLHFQTGAAAQAKLVRCVAGAVLDVAVDLRCGSPTFGRHLAVELTGENKRQIYLPRGMAHGFSVLSAEAMFQYKCDSFYDPRAEGGISLLDPALGIDWRIAPADMILSSKDRERPTLASLPTSALHFDL